MARYEGDERRQTLGFRLSREISIADIVAVIGIGIPALIWAAKMDARMAQIEVTSVAIRADYTMKDSSLDAQREALRKEVKEDLREINRKLDQLIERNGRGR